LEQNVEALRDLLGEFLFQSFRKLDVGVAQNGLETLRSVVKAATRSQQDYFTRLFWFVHRAKRFEQMGVTSGTLQPTIQGLGLTTPTLPIVDSEVTAWLKLVSKIEGRIQAARQIGEYSRKLTALSVAPKLEEIWQSIAQQRNKLANESLKLWEYCCA
jgi:hypothetical protein